ncbi:MAG: NAD(P)/FAD-dependent oxidoreductase [Candidatus Nitrosocaldaceae archaeon]
MYDIIVVGAGPAGLSAAYAAASRGAKVLVIEKDDGIGINVRTSGATWVNDMKKFGIDKEFFNVIRRIKIYSPSNHAVINDEYERACILDVRRVYQYLAQKAIEKGAEIILKSNVDKCLRENNRVIGVKAKNLNRDLEFKSRLVIDASGFNSIIAREVGFAAWKRYGVGAEYECYVDNIEKDSLILMVGKHYSPAGYSWIFPLDEHRVRIGVGIGRPESREEPLSLLNNIIKKRYKPLDELGKIEPIELHYGFIPNDGMRERLVYDGLMLVGDSAGYSNPLVLEGIRYAINFGRIAGEVGTKALVDGCNVSSLKEYEDECKKVKNRIDMAIRVQNRWLSLDDKGWDNEISIINDLEIDEFIDFLRADFTVEKMLRLAINHPKTIVRQLFRLVAGY